jgi:hypothetical protein
VLSECCHASLPVLSQLPHEQLIFARPDPSTYTRLSTLNLPGPVNRRVAKMMT